MAGAFGFLEDLQNVAFEVEGIVGREGGGVVAGLHENFEQMRVAAGIVGGFAEHGEE